MICFEAARIMADEGLRDYQRAKRKACQRLDLHPGRLLPSNTEIHAALTERLGLFDGPGLSTLRRQRLELAVATMRWLEPFSPRLVGSLLDGSVLAESPVELHAFAATPEEFCLFLDERTVPFEQFDRRHRFGGDRHKFIPGVRFSAEDTAVEVTIFPDDRFHEAPLSPVDGRPMERARLGVVSALMQDD